MSVVIAIPSGTWIRLSGTDWEVFQDSGDVAILGDEPVIVRIRRAESGPRIWGPYPPIEYGAGITR
jgi:hypothetical protein